MANLGSWLPRDENFATLNRENPVEAGYDLAVKYAPNIRFDAREPLLPCVVGYTVFPENAHSLTFPREIRIPPNANRAIEYAIWWDWDIGHLYELEHIWIYINEPGEIVGVEASWHGGWNEMLNEDGELPLEDGRVTLYSESGKHAFAATTEKLQERAQTTIASCGSRAGLGGVHVTPLFEGIIYDRNPVTNQLVTSFCRQEAFTPTFEYSQKISLDAIPHVPCESLLEWIPSRVGWWCEHLAEIIPPDQRAVWRIAHRGASAYAPDNSRASFVKAAEMGADMVEMDIRVTSDNIPVVAHDAEIVTSAGKHLLIASLTYGELFAALPEDARPMVFSDALSACKDLGMGLYLDIKDMNESAASLVLRDLEAADYMSYTICASNRPDFVAEIKAQNPGIMTSILFHSTHILPVQSAQAVGADFVHPCWERLENPHTLLSEEWLAAVRDAGLGVICWHEERYPVILELMKRGVNGICSDKPDLLLQASNELHNTN